MAIVDLKRAVDLLAGGAVVAIPTETVYGLAGRIDREPALRAIFATKQRPFFDPLIVHVAEPGEARALTTAWHPVHQALSEAFWPGPLTLVLPKADSVSSLITSGLDTVGVRCPDHALAREVLRLVGVPLAAPSANRFGRTSPTTARHVAEEFDDAVATLDGGPSVIGVESTVVHFDGRTLNVLRPGAVTTAALDACLRRAGLAVPVARLQSHRSPGHLEAHYQPANKVVCAAGTLDAAELARRAFALTGDAAVVRLRLPADPALAARTLYAELRRLSQTPAVIVYSTEELGTSVEWEAILDRLRRASTTTWT